MTLSELQSQLDAFARGSRRAAQKSGVRSYVYAVRPLRYSINVTLDGVEGVKLPLALAELGLIDEYEFVVQPRLVGHGPTLFAGLSKSLDLRLVSRQEFGSGAVAMRYEPRVA
jgi:RibD C-terminal domain